MTMNPKQFEKNLLLYGANVSMWPEEIRQAGLQAIETSSDCRALLAEEERFEQVLKTRTYEEQNNDLAKRIIFAAQPKKKTVWIHFVGFFSELVREFNLPRPVFTALYVSLILVLIVGFAIGFSNTNGSGSMEWTQTDLQAFLYDEGEVL
jgi:hypothetical protein